jgi:hypothetical protein
LFLLFCLAGGIFYFLDVIDLGRMDYSLLIGVKRERFRVLHNGSAIPVDGSPDGSPVLSEAQSFSANVLLNNKDASGGYRALVVDGPGCYYLGLIDILQGWTWKKRFERFFKVYFQFKDGDGISALPPNPYADRFFQRCVLDTFEGMNDWRLRMDSTFPTVTTSIDSSIALSAPTFVSDKAIVDLEESQISPFGHN